MNRTERWLGTVRELLTGERARARGDSVDDARLFRAFAAAERAAEVALGASQSAGASSAQQRNALDAAADALTLLFSRAQSARSSVAAARDSLDQIRLIALNAGLEGARLGDPLGKPLIMVAEEMRNQSLRALAALDQHTTLLDHGDRERDKLREQVQAAQQRTAEVARDLLQTQAAQRDVSSALGEVGQRVKEVTRTDPETAALVGDAADHARALMVSLSSLATKPHRASLIGSLGPTLGPLIKLLREEFRGDLGGEQ